MTTKTKEKRSLRSNQKATKRTGSLVLAIWLLVFLTLPLTAQAAGAIEVYGAGGGGGGGGGGLIVTSTPGAGGAGGAGGVAALNGFAGGGGGNGYAGSYGGGGGGGGGSAGAGGRGGDANGYLLSHGAGGAAGPGTGEGGQGATPGAAGTDEGGGWGGNGVPGLSAVLNSPEAAPDSIAVVAGSGGGDGGADSGVGGGLGGSGSGGVGGSASLVLSAANVSVSLTGSVVVQNGASGRGGYIGRSGGEASLQCAGTLSAPALIFTNPLGGGVRLGGSVVDVDIGTLQVSAATTITVDGTHASEVSLGTVNVAAGQTLTITSANGGKLTVGTLNMGLGGQVTVAPGVLTLTGFANPALALSGTPIANTAVGGNYSESLAGQVSGNVGQCAFVLQAGSTLPAGLVLSAAGVVSGTPTTAVANHPFTVQVTDVLGRTATANYTLTVFESILPAPSLTLAGANPSGIVGQVGGLTITVNVTGAYNELINFQASINPTKTASRIGDGPVSFAFTAAEMNALAVGSYPITVASAATAHNAANPGTVVGTLTVLARGGNRPSSLPQTGDAFPLGWMVAGLAVLVVGAVVVALRLRKGKVNP